MGKTTRRLMLVAVLAAAAWGLAQGPAAGEGTMLEKVRFLKPAGGEKSLELIEAEGGALQMVVAGYAGPALPGEDSIQVVMEAPAAEKIFAAYIKFTDRHWSIPSWPSSLKELPPLTQYVLWQEPSGGYGAMINLTGGGMITYLAGSPDGVVVSAHSHDKNFAPSRVPLFAAGQGEDPYQLTRDLYAFALDKMREIDPDGVIGRVRWEKDFPEIFEYVGWCSWNAYYQKATEEKLLASAASFKAQGFPVKWMIIDDGWETLQQTVSKAKKKRGKSLSGFEANPELFPNGLAHVIGKLKGEYGIDKVGVWFTLNGYWNGVALNSPLGEEYRDALLAVSDEVAVPDPRSDAGQKFWDGFFTSLRAAGVDLVKTDDQSTGYEFTEDLIPVGHAYAGAQRNYQAMAGKHFDHNLINCMSMNVDTMYQWKDTNIARASRDFYPAQHHNPRQHTVDSVMNSLWFSSLSYPDYDMWQTYDQHREYHAVARAISGGPLYFTDRPGRERYEHLRPLVLGDGRIIRVPEPGLPARQSLFHDPYVSGRPLVAYARAGEGGVIAAWNVDRFERPVKGAIRPADVEGMSGDSFAVHEYFSDQTVVLGSREELPLKMRGWDARIYSVAPVIDGFAALGLANKYASTATVMEVVRGEGRVEIKLLESGPFLAYCETRPQTIKFNGEKMADSQIKYVDRVLRLDGPAGAGEVATVEIIW